jgi:hypothetical protein
MAKANVKVNSAVKEEKLITLTKEQFVKLIEIHSILDNASDTLNDIDGDETAFMIGKKVGDACSDIVNAFNDLGDIIDDKQDEIFDFEIEDEN